jgi:Rogdi leucine zipper containing protein
LAINILCSSIDRVNQIESDCNKSFSPFSFKRLRSIQTKTLKSLSFLQSSNETIECSYYSNDGLKGYITIVNMHITSGVLSRQSLLISKELTIKFKGQMRKFTIEKPYLLHQLIPVRSCLLNTLDIISSIQPLVNTVYEEKISRTHVVVLSALESMQSELRTAHDSLAQFNEQRMFPNVECKSDAYQTFISILYLDSLLYWQMTSLSNSTAINLQFSAHSSVSNTCNLQNHF